MIPKKATRFFRPRRIGGEIAIATALLFLLLGCEKKYEVTVIGANSEHDLREKLGIPAKAKRVIVFGQNAHMDLDWQLTFPEYYDRYVEKIIRSSLDILDENPRYFYSMAEMAFLKHHLEKHPEDRERLKRHTKSGRFRIVGGGITSPDVVLPTGEALLRDFMLGRRFTMEEFGVGSATAWLPDDFGLGTGLPSLLTAAGYKYAALSRADGIDNFIMPNMKYTPRPGSTAEKLFNEKAIDFWWKGADGTRILTHWMPYTYCQGDNIDYDEPFQLPGGHLGPFKPDAESTNAKIAMYVSQLADVSPTDYMFVPIGCDFALPKPRLVEYMDNWNATKYSETGVWALAATFEEFARLVEFQGKRVPELEVDIAPYWMGFFGSRVELKKLHREASYLLMQAEKFATLESLFDPAGYPKAELRELWEKLAWSNHHDYLPGTSPDKVYKEEQLPILRDVILRGQSVMDSALRSLTARSQTTDEGADPFVVWNSLSRSRSEVVNAGESTDGQGTLFAANEVPPMGFRVLARQGGPASTSRATPRFAAMSPSKQEVDIISYLDDGGMWRLGHEMDGCRFERVALARPGSESAEVVASEPLATVTITRLDLEGSEVRQEEWSYAGQPGLLQKLTASAPKDSTITARVETRLGHPQLVTATPYAWTARPLKRHYDPTFWPVLEWLDVSDPTGKGMLFVSLASQGWHVGENADVEMMITRNASLEKCQVLGAIGTDPDPHEVSFWIIPHDGAIDAAEAYRQAFDLHQPLISVPTDAHEGTLPASKSFIDLEGAELMVFKRSEIDDSLVLRLFNPLDTPVNVKMKSALREFGLKQVYESDAMEEPGKRLPDLTDDYTLRMDRHLLTLIIR
ncbi:MAG: hypothetical protein HYT87_03085 [Nitrospirae bacterium]|nr:hypothetical protein [Nitrospirota bacterium]